MVKVRPMTDDERALEEWEHWPEDIFVAEFDNGAALYTGCPKWDSPGEGWALYGGERWKIEPLAEVDLTPGPVTITLPRLAYRLIAAAMIVGSLDFFLHVLEYC